MAKLKYISGLVKLAILLVSALILSLVYSEKTNAAGQYQYSETRTAAVSSELQSNSAPELPGIREAMQKFIVRGDVRSCNCCDN